MKLFDEYAIAMYDPAEETKPMPKDHFMENATPYPQPSRPLTEGERAWLQALKDDINGDPSGYALNHFGKTTAHTVAWSYERARTIGAVLDTGKINPALLPVLEGWL